MNINGKLTLFVAKRVANTKEGEKTFTDISATIGSKREDGTYLNKSVKVKLIGKNFPEEKISALKENTAYAMEVEEGFIAVDSYVKNGEEKRDLVLVISKGHCTGTKEVQRKVVEVNDDLPF